MIQNLPENVKWIESRGGLADDRQKALNACETDYIFYIANKFIEMEDVEEAVEEIIDKNWIGCGFLINAYSKNKYLEWATNKRYKTKFTAGERKSIGTPFLWNVKILKKIGFDRNSGYADDTILCENLRKYGYRFGYVNKYCREFITYASQKKRFQMYGKSDSAYYEFHYRKWQILRKIKSLLHPITAEFIADIRYLPFYFWIVFNRYQGWIMENKNRKLKIWDMYL